MSDITRESDVRAKIASAQPWNTGSRKGNSEQENSYEELKNRVHSLKREQQRALGSQKAAHMAETSSLLEQRLAFEAKIAKLEDQISGLNQQVKQTNERSAKLRSHCERDKKALQAQLDQAMKSLQGIDSEHASEVKKLTEAHEQQLTTLSEELTRALQDAEAEQARLRSEHEAQTFEVEQWCQGEIEAVRHVLSCKLASADEHVHHWQQQHAEEMERRQNVEESVLRAEEHLKQVMEDNTAMAAELEACRRQIMGLGNEMEHLCAAAAAQQEEVVRALMAKHAEEVGLLKKNHRHQLDTIDSRLHDVLGRKDAAIVALKGELGDVHAKLQKFEALLFDAGLQA